MRKAAHGVDERHNHVVLAVPSRLGEAIGGRCATLARDDFAPLATGAGRDEVFQVNGVSRVSNPTAHGTSLAKSERTQWVVRHIHLLRDPMALNGDGFGIGWYGERARPGVFRDIRPAWSDDNLLSIAHQIRSRLFFAHVRASTGTASTRANCHPFAVGEWLFMHNGQIGGYSRIRRRLEQEVPDDLLLHRAGTTDSEVIFLLLLANGLERDPLAALELTLALVERCMLEADISDPLRLTAAFTNGQRIFAARYATDLEPPTLYPKMRPEGSGVVVVSEPLDEQREGWTAVLPQQAITVSAEKIEAIPLRSAPRLTR
jgi:predicted glutamine amidotransferase